PRPKEVFFCGELSPNLRRTHRLLLATSQRAPLSSGGEAGLPHGESADLPSPARTLSGLDRRSRLLRDDGRVVRAELDRQSEVVAVAGLLDRNQVGGADLEAQRSVVTGVILSD